jgi:hypothetical protein
MFATMQAGMAAATPPGQRAPNLPSERAIEESCGEMPESFRRCMAQDYFRQHADDCLQEMQRMGERGRQDSENARRQLNDLRHGRTLRMQQEPTEGASE